MKQDIEARIKRRYATMMGLDEAMPLSVMPDSEAFAILNAVGTHVIVEHIALGRMLTEIAANFDVPQMAFRRWIAQAVPRDLLAQATKAGADALATRAMMVLTVEHRTGEEQRSMAALAKQLVNAAQCMSPDDWMPSRISGAGDNMAPPVVIQVTQAPPAPAPVTIEQSPQGFQPPKNMPQGVIPMSTLTQRVSGTPTVGAKPRTAANPD